MIRRSITFAVMAALSMAGPLGAATPKQVLEKAISAAGGREALARLGIVRITITEDEVTDRGEESRTTVTAVVDMARPNRMRLEMPAHRVVMARDGGEAWATVNGRLDKRPFTRKMVIGTLHNKLFPILLPFTLDDPGIELVKTTDVRWSDTDVSMVVVRFTDGFFASPVMNTPWDVLFDRKTSEVVAAEYVPSQEYLKIGAEPARYRFLRLVRIDGVRLPQTIVLEGLDHQGGATGHTRTVKITWEPHQPPNPGLFMNPERLEAIESGDVPEPL